MRNALQSEACHSAPMDSVLMQMMSTIENLHEDLKVIREKSDRKENENRHEPERKGVSEEIREVIREEIRVVHAALQMQREDFERRHQDLVESLKTIQHDLDQTNSRVQALEQALKIRPEHLISQPLPFVHDLSKVNSAITNSSQKRSIDPLRVFLNTRFKAEQEDFVKSFEFPPDLMIKNNASISDNKVCSEEGLLFFLKQNVFEKLNELSNREIITNTANEMKLTIQPDGASASLGIIDVLWELKRRNLIKNGYLDLATAVREGDRLVIDALEQLVGYLFLQNICWGILTTYEYFWAIEVRENGDVYISPHYKSSDSVSCSVLSMLWYVLQTARQQTINKTNKFPRDHFQVATSTSDSKSLTEFASQAEGEYPSRTNGERKAGDSNRIGDQQSSSSRRFGSTLQAKSLTCPRCQYCNGAEGPDNWQIECMLADRPGRLTCKVKIANGELVVLKAYETEERLNLEVKCYQQLNDMQGRMIPRLLRAGFKLSSCLALGGSSNRRRFAMVLSWEGLHSSSCCGMGSPSLSLEALQSTRKVLEAMHMRGVAHGDVKEDNMAFNVARRQSIVFDFSHAALKGDIDFDKKCTGDLQGIDTLIQQNTKTSSSCLDDALSLLLDSH